MVYNFKKIQTVPSGKDFIDITLSKTQRKTPTEIHRHYAISRIRRFYMRKVKYTQQNYHDRLSQILTDFPLLNDIHPFYSDLINILYDKDHYKLALGQLNNARHLIDNVAKDYLRLLKYGDSMYRCQSLKKAALGRMCMIIKKLSPSLAYLEQVRQHLARLPTIDPATRTLIVCGYPNVGKSSMMNKVTRANVDVQPYAFTTKSLFVGHFDYKYIRWQVIDTPGILDHPLEDRNTVEMLSITALAHLQAAILFLIDISEQCGRTIEEQVHLFNSIKPLFAGKPLLIVTNKIDVVRPENVRPDAWKLIQDLTNPDAGGNANTTILPMSTLTDEGVEQVKEKACDILLESRVEKKLKSKVLGSVAHRVHVAFPTRRDEKERPPCIPKSIIERGPAPAPLTKEERAVRDMQRAYEEEQENDAAWERGEVPGMNSKLWRERWQLANPDWKFDIIPEIIDGKTIFDFVDPDIEKMLEDLEQEENERLQALDDEEAMKSSDSELDEESKDLLQKIRSKKKMLALQNQSKIDLNDENDTGRNLSRANKRRSLSQLETQLNDMGMSEEQAAESIASVRERSRSRSKSRVGRKRERSVSASNVRDEEAHLSDKKKAKREKSRSRDVSLTPKAGAGYKNVQDLAAAQKIHKRLLVARGKEAKKGEADRSIPNLMPRHLYTGKRGIGKTERR